MPSKYLLLLYIFSLALLSSCNKGDDGLAKLDPEGDCFTAMVDGAFFNSDYVTGTDVGFVLTIGATLGTSTVQIFGLSLFTTDVGTYDITAMSGADVTATYAEGPFQTPTQYAALTGSLTITEHDIAAQRIKGSFAFEGTGPNNMTVTVTEGIFDLGYD